MSSNPEIADPRWGAIYKNIVEIFGPSPIEEPYYYSAIAVTDAILQSIKDVTNVEYPETAAFDVVAWLRHEGNYGPDACIQEREWCDKANAAADEIKRLRAEVERKGYHG